jgi:Flp pilus assembly protein TadD
LLDRRQKLPEARALIARAYKAAPENGAIIDSMGWAEFVAGNYPEAVQLLEKARAAEPADPTIADHLGDALWRAGRKFEARHAWTSAAALSPEAKLAALLGRKLDFGLDVALAGK